MSEHKFKFSGERMTYSDKTLSENINITFGGTITYESERDLSETLRIYAVTALNSLSEENVPFDGVYLCGKRLTELLNELSGENVISFSLSEFYPAESDIPLIVRAKKAAAEKEAQANAAPSVTQYEFCPRCGLKLGEEHNGARFCSGCGAPITVQKSGSLLYDMKNAIGGSESLKSLKQSFTSLIGNLNNPNGRQQP